jgi:hypothetical protein
MWIARRRQAMGGALAGLGGQAMTALRIDTRGRALRRPRRPDFRPTNGLKRSYTQTRAIQEMPANKGLFEFKKP